MKRIFRKYMELMKQTLKALMDTLVGLFLVMWSGAGIYFTTLYVLHYSHSSAVIYALLATASAGMWLGIKIHKDHSSEECR